MEQKVNLYLAASGGLISGNIRRGWGCVLEVSTAAGITTREGFGEVTGTHRLAILIALSHALGRFNRPCEIHVHTEDGWVLAMLERCLDGWAQNDYKDSKGKEIEHRAEWEAVYKLKEGHLLIPEAGRHSYSSWLESEFKRRSLGEAIEDGQQYRQMEMGEALEHIEKTSICEDHHIDIRSIAAPEVAAPVVVQKKEWQTPTIEEVTGGDTSEVFRAQLSAAEPPQKSATEKKIAAMLNNVRNLSDMKEHQEGEEQ